jgi:hypothetical protein
MTREDFDRYIDAFNRGDLQTLKQFYCEDVVFRLGAKMEIRGRENIVAFYTEVLKKVQEVLTIRQVVADDTGLAAEIDTEFKALVDDPDFIAGPLVKGESIFITSLVIYRFRDGRVARVQSARASG